MRCDSSSTMVRSIPFAIAATIAVGFASLATAAAARTGSARLKLPRGSELAGFIFDVTGTLKVDEVTLSTPEAEALVGSKLVEIYPSRDGRLFAIVFDDEDGQHHVRIYDRTNRRVGPFESVAGLDHIEWSPDSKHLLLISSYEGQFLRLYDVDRQKFSDLVDISGRGVNPKNECIDREPATNWHVLEGTR